VTHYIRCQQGQIRNRVFRYLPTVSSSFLLTIMPETVPCMFYIISMQLLLLTLVCSLVWSLFPCDDGCSRLTTSLPKIKTKHLQWSIDVRRSLERPIGLENLSSYATFPPRRLTSTTSAPESPSGGVKTQGPVPRHRSCRTVLGLRRFAFVAGDNNGHARRPLAHEG